MFKTNNYCRLCGESSLIMRIPMPNLPPVDDYLLPGDVNLDRQYFPMDLYQCRDCGHAQLIHVVDPGILFGNYIYKSSSSPDLLSHFKKYSDVIKSRFKINSSSNIVDIGGNDGLYLSNFRDITSNLTVIDPSTLAVKDAKSRGLNVINDYFNENSALSFNTKFGPADYVFANNVFSHMNDMRSFVENVKNILKFNGVFVFEVSYLKALIENKVVDYIYHEHLAHHSIVPLRSFLTSLGLKLFDVEELPVKGGSIRCYVSQINSWHEINIRVDELIDNEYRLNLYESDTYDDFNKYFRDLKYDIAKILREYGDSNFASYGASATATVLNRFLDINCAINFVVDDNIDRQGRLSPGDHKMVCSSDYLLKSDVKLTIISSWRFSDMIIARNKSYLDRGGLFLIPLPVPRLVGAI